MFGIMGAAWWHPVVAGRHQDAAVRIPRAYYRKYFCVYGSEIIFGAFFVIL